MSKVDAMTISERVTRSRSDVWMRLVQLKKRGYRIGDLIDWANHLCPEPTGRQIAQRAKCV